MASSLVSRGGLLAHCRPHFLIWLPRPHQFLSSYLERFFFKKILLKVLHWSSFPPPLTTFSPLPSPKVLTIPLCLQVLHICIQVRQSFLTLNIAKENPQYFICENKSCFSPLARTLNYFCEHFSSSIHSLFIHQLDTFIGCLQLGRQHSKFQRLSND